MHQVLDLIGKIYEADADPAEWPKAMMLLADVAGGNEAVLGGLGAGRMPVFVAPRTSPEMIRHYAEHYHMLNPIHRGMAGQPLGRAMLDAELTNIDEFRQGAFYNEWCRVQDFYHGVAMNLHTAANGRAGLMVTSRRNFSRSAMSMLELVSPHLTRAFQINQVLFESKAANLSAFSALDLADRGVLLVSASGMCEPGNQLAEEVLQRGDAIILRHGRLECVHALDNTLLQRALHNCAMGKAGLPGTTVQVMRGEERMPLHLMCVPFITDGWTQSTAQHQVMIIVTDPEARLGQKVEQMRLNFRLTRAEADLVAELARGGDRNAIADRLGVTLATVRTQLTSVFDKTGVRRQPELVRLLMEQP